jgi:hypothetical protein
MTLDGSDNVSIWTDAWSLSNITVVQNTAGDRPNFDGTDVVFDAGNSKNFDVTIGLAANDWTWVYGTTSINNGGASQYLFDADDGSPRLIVAESRVAKYAHDTNSDAWASGAAFAAGAHYVTHIMKAAASAEVRLDGSATTGLAYTQTQIGDEQNCRLGSDKSDGNYYNGKLRYIALFSGSDSTDTTALETVGAEIMGV